MACDPQTQLANVAAVARQTAQMVQTFRAWPESYWRRPAFCPDWQAADAVAHLATGGDFYAQVVTSGRAGDPQLPWGTSDLPSFRATRAAAAKQLIEAGPAALLNGFIEGSEKLQHVLESLQVAELSKVARHPRGLVPLGYWVGMRLTELVVHDWDIRQPHEAPAALSPAALPAMITVLPEMQIQFLEQRLAEGLDGMHLLRAGDAAWAFAVQGKTVTYQADAPATYDTCLSADAESLILLTMGRADVQAKLRSNALTVTGDTAKGQRLCETLFRTF